MEKDVKWVHLDIAGPVISTGKKGPICYGGTGFGTQLLINYLKNQIV